MYATLIGSLHLRDQLPKNARQRFFAEFKRIFIV
jgi:hypothetical protein